MVLVSYADLEGVDQPVQSEEILGTCSLMWAFTVRLWDNGHFLDIVYEW